MQLSPEQIELFQYTIRAIKDDPGDSIALVQTKYKGADCAVIMHVKPDDDGSGEGTSFPLAILVTESMFPDIVNPFDDSDEDESEDDNGPRCGWCLTTLGTPDVVELGFCDEDHRARLYRRLAAIEAAEESERSQPDRR